MTDPELVEGILKRDRTAFQHLVDKYQRDVIKTAYHFLGNMEDAEDLSQDIFIEIIRSVNKFRNTASLRTWIYRITVNHSLNQLKKNKRRGFFLTLETFLGIAGNRFTPETAARESSDSLQEAENNKILYMAISNLPENQRIAFILNKFDDHKYKDVADIMNLSVPAVESLIHRAKISLQARLADHFTEYKKTDHGIITF